MSLETNPNIIRELILYFARFPNRDNVLKRFRKRPGAAYHLFEPYYSDLKAEIEAYPETSLCPAIQDMVIAAAGEDYLAKQIEDMNGKVYMLVDYGNFGANKQTDPITRKEDTFQLAITVAMQFKPEDMDQFEMAALSDYTLNALRCVRSQLVADDASCSGTEDKIVFPHQIIPFYARDLQNSIGWSLVFSQRVIDWL